MPSAPTRRICTRVGCGRLTSNASRRCWEHPRDQASRNHYGVPRQRRGLGVEFDRLVPVVLARDGGLCTLRLRGCLVVATTADHIIPRSRGGLTRLDNLRASCSRCNYARGARDLAETA